MNLNAYSIYDRKALVFSPPFFTGTDAQAARMVFDSMGPNSSLSRHPADYVVYRVGSFDDVSGLIRPLDPVAHVCDVVTLLPTQPQPELFRTADLSQATSEAVEVLKQQLAK